MEDFEKKPLAFSAVFSNHCVLQRERNISLFGTAEANKSLKLSLFNKNGQLLAENTGKADNSGHWLLQLSPQEAQEECKLVLTDEKTSIELTDIAIGEVWLAGGQSNMEFELQNCTEKEELDDEKAGENVRFYYTNKNGWKDSAFYEQEKASHWETWQSKEKGKWSAVGYFFAKNLSKELGVTVGVIGCNWGGTSASVWTDRAYMEKDSELKIYLDEYDEAIKGKSIEEQCKEYDDYVVYHTAWDAKYQQMLKANPFTSWAEAEAKLGKCQWPGPKSCKNPYRPSGLYECMVSRLTPYTIKGVIWYQGENDCHRPKVYNKLFSALIENWRDAFKNKELPFIFAQLPMHRYFNDKDAKEWAELRQSQQKVFDSVKNTYMTNILDQGAYNDIHPKAKATVASRMATIALSKVYNKTGLASHETGSACCACSDTLVKGDKMILTFKNVCEGLEYREDETRLQQYIEMEKVQGNAVAKDFTGAEIAGEDGVFYPAKIEIEGKDKIVLSSDKVSSPKSARYAWYNYGPVTLYTKSALPVFPFNVEI